MPKTRREDRHASIFTVHGPPGLHKKKSAKEKAKKKTKPKLRPNVAEVMDFINAQGVKHFIQRIFLGSVAVKKYGQISALEIIAWIHKDRSLRNLISNRWRQEDDHHHEWIPCTYLCDIIIKAKIANDFRYLRLANAMRTPTTDIIFEPKLFKTVTPSGRPQYAILQGHPGALKFHAPAGDPLGKVPLGHPVAVDNSPQTAEQSDFHTAILKQLKDAGSPLDLVDRLEALYIEWCWAGQFPTANAVADVWPYYYWGGAGPQNISLTVGGAVPALVGGGGVPPWPQVKARFHNVLACFNTWRGIANGAKPTSNFTFNI